MGAPQSNGEWNVPNRGQVRVMEYDGADWYPKGAYIEGPGEDYLCGYAVALAKDGTTVATGCPFARNQTGTTFSYTWGGEAWARWGLNQVGGQEERDNSGAAVAVNARGSIMAVGTPNAPVNGNQQSGSVQVYRYNWDTSSWNARGQALIGATAGDKFGYTVAMSDSGNVIACGAPYNSDNGLIASGLVRAFIWDEIYGYWVQLGTDIYGKGAGDQFGGSVAISSSGSVLAIGGHLTDTEGGTDSGVVKIYGWGGEDWKQVGDDLTGDQAKEYSGWSVALSGDGTVVAVGAPYADGRVRLFRRIDLNVSSTESPSLEPTAQPSVEVASEPRSSPTMSPVPTQAPIRPAPSLSVAPTALPAFPDVDDAYSRARPVSMLIPMALATLLGWELIVA